MKKFPGFTSDETFTPIPDSFFRDLLAAIDDADELKVTLYALWRIGNMEGRVHVLRTEDFTGLVTDSEPALKKAVARGTLIRVQKESSAYYFLNSPRGRAAAEAFAKGQTDVPSAISAAPVERPDIFKLYEENIGPLTPMIADMLKDAEKDYPNIWFEEAFEIAVARNVRNWKYIEAILKRWKEKGKDERKDQQDAGQNFKRYSEGEFAEYIKRD
jgi:DNA replication protein